MKKLFKLLILSLVLFSCTKTTDLVEPITPTANIISAVKLYAGGNPSILVTYRLTNTQLVSKTYINALNYGFSGAATVEVPTVEGQAVVYDHGNFNSSANYYFILNLKDGSRITTQVQQFNF